MQLYPYETREPIGTSDSDTEPRHKQRQCPFSGGFVYYCEKDTCQDCDIRIEALAKANEDCEIADNMRSYWGNLNNGSADWRG